MVDTAIFVGMGGAKEALRSVQMIANNLANANTVGFRADYQSMQSSATRGDKHQTRAYGSLGSTYSDFNQGPLIHTGNDLDVAISGSGFIAVQTKDGQEGYTRAGNLQLTKDGVLVTAKGDMVLGAKGLITVPPATKIMISETGQVSARLRGQSETEIADLGRIKLVDAPVHQMKKGLDGLFYLTGEATPQTSDTIKLIAGSLEGSNVNPVKSLSELIDISRQFEMHTKLMKSIEDNSSHANQLLSITD